MTRMLRWLISCLALTALVWLAAPQALAGEGAAGLAKVRADAAYWTKMGRGDKAATLWRVLLQADPTNTEALVALALYEASIGHTEEALALHKRLEAVQPGFAGLKQLRRTLELGDRFPKLLAEARALAKAGKIPEALAKFREAFGNAPPTGHVGREYYQLLASTKEGWQEASDGLARLKKENPNDPLAELAYAKHLTYNEDTRRQGIERLEALAGNEKVDAAIRAQARDAWRKALEWLNVKVTDKELYKAFETKVGEDNALRKRFEVDPKPAVPRRLNKVLRQAFKLLNTGKIDEAEVLFAAQLKKRPKSIAALVGLGSVELARGKGHFKKAQEMFLVVKKRAGKRPKYWKRSLRTATFFATLEDAEAAGNAGEVAKAEALLGKAIEVAPENRRHAYFLLGILHLRGARYEAAQLNFAKVLADDPKHIDALCGQVQVLIAQRKLEEAIALNAKIVEMDPKKGIDIGKVKSEIKRSEAATHFAKNDYAKALALLNEALALDPDNGAARLDRAYVYAAMLNLDAAAAELDSMEAADPKAVAAKRRSMLPSVHLARALLLERGGHYPEAQASLDKVGEKDMDESALQLKRRLRIRREVARAVQIRVRDPLASTHEPFLTLIPETSAEPDLGMVVATGLSNLDCHAPALAMASRLTKLPSPDPIGIRIQYANLLARAGRLREAAELLQDLQFEPGYSPRHAKAVGELRLGLAIRQADIARDEGDLAAAWALMEPVLKDYPDRPEALAAMARLYQASGRHDLALKNYEKMLQTNPGDVELWAGAISSALAVKDEVKAKRLVRDALKRFPKSDRIYLAAGRTELQLGDEDKAESLLRKAQRLNTDARTSDPVANPDPKGNVLATDNTNQPDAEKDAAVGEQIHNELTALEIKYAPLVAVEPHLRYRDGQLGLGHLLDLGFDLSGRVYMNSKTWAALRVAPTSLDAGALDLSTGLLRSTFGQLGTTKLANSNLTLDQTAIGTAIGVEGGYRGLGLRLSTTPLGFPLQTGVGAASFRGQFGRLILGMELHRNVLTDSLLSYAGRTDPVSGLVWGQALANGAEATVKIEERNLLWFFSGGGDIITGTRIPDNTRAQVGAGLRVRFAEGASTKFISGFTLAAMWNSRNLRYFSFGQGGYFSPQSFLHVAVPIEWSLTSAHTRASIGGDFGVNFLTESSSGYYPADSSLQLVSVVGPGSPVVNTGAYAGKSTMGPAFNLRGSVRHELSPEFILGLDLAAHSALDYREFIGVAYLAYRFAPGTNLPREATALPP